MAQPSTQWAWLLVIMWCWGRGLTSVDQYVGIGYNLLTANPDGGLAERGGVDPGLLITRKILDLRDPRAVKVQHRHSCGQVSTISTFYGAKSYQDKLSLGVNLQGTVIAGLINAMFSLSPRFSRTESATNVKHQVFQDDQNVCNLGRVRFADELSDWLNVNVTDNFASAVCQLPQHYDQRAYMDFLDQWGTHMTIEVDIGTKVIHRSQTSLAEFVHHVAQTSGVDVSLGGSYMGFGASLGVNFNSFRSHDSYNRSFGSYHETLEVGTLTLPEPIRVVLVSLDTALQSKYWNFGDSLTSRGLCDVNVNTTVIGQNLRQGLREYATYKMTHTPTDPQLVIPLTWPRGTYGLPKALTGCPGGRVTWYEGFRFFDTMDVFTSNHISPNLHLAGLWHEDSDLRMEFCMKGDRTLSEFDVDWPAGDYCLFQYGTCPPGFQQGFVQWDDNDVNNNNGKGGTVPDGKYGSNTKIFFCCRNDNLPTHSVFLPIDRPFYLFRHTRGCQHVHNMKLREEIVQWDEAYAPFGFSFSSDHRLGGAHPFDDSDGRNHRLHFCFYYSTSSTDEVSESADLIG